MGSAIDLLPDEEAMWHATIKALRSNGATPSEAIEGENLLLDAYRRQRDALPSQVAKVRPKGEPRE